MVTDVNEKGTNLRDYELINYKFTKVCLNGAELNLHGNINNISFQLKGTLYKDNSNQIYLGDLEDIDNNFQVALFAVDFNPGSLPMLNSDMSRFKNDDKAVHLYLIENGTRNFYFIEDIDLWDLGWKITNVGKHIEFEESKRELRMWYCSYFQPVETITQIINTQNFPSNYEYNEYQERIHTYVRDVFGHKIYELTRVALYSYHPYNVGETAEFYTGIEILAATTLSMTEVFPV